ncbi:MAG: PadR family transcriptional regulator [Candidatus Dormibacteraeota bacterium]|nr:PadR family transcriptional regulator [Candidatus Dormibacteraeota bacterium]
MTRRKVANPLGLAVLALLAERPMHPYEMAATLRQRGKEYSIRINYGSLYSVIAALVRAKFIVTRETSREGARPVRTVYSLTDAGWAELDDWLPELLRDPVKEYPQFEAGLSLMPYLPPAQVEALLDERIRRLDGQSDRLRTEISDAARQGLDRLFLVEAEYSLAMQEAERNWVAGLKALIRDSPDFTRSWIAYHEHRTKTKRGGKDAGDS